MRCPYCLSEVQQPSEDHIFPRFLGGKRTIRCCKPCNDRFGHTFEGAASATLQAQHVFINSWGLPMAAASPTWKAAHTVDGELYDLKTADAGPMPILSKPLIVKDSQGNVQSFKARSPKEAEAIKNGLLAAGKAKGFEPVPAATVNELIGVEHLFSVNTAIKRMALKMCYAVSQLIDVSEGELTDARHDLIEAPEAESQNLLVDFLYHPSLDDLRLPLTHTLYVETGDKFISGFVQFFGVVSVYCKLGTRKAATRSSVLGLLDPVTGSEEFREIDALNLAHPPFVLSMPDAQKGVQSWVEKFRNGAVARGATHPPLGLKITDVDFGPLVQQPTSWSSSTVEFLFPLLR